MSAGTRMMRVLTLSLLCVFAGGCTGWRAVRRPGAPPAPRQFLQAIQQGEPDEHPWWLAFGDSTLNTIMSEALAANLTLEQAVARLDQFRALHSVAKSTLWPTVGGEGSWRESGDLGDPPATGTIPATGGSLTMTGAAQTYNVTVSAAYELDIWGRLAAGRAAAHADLRANEEGLRALVLSLAAQVGRTYYRVVELRRQQNLLTRTIASYENSYTLVLDRYQRGVAPSLDVYQAETNLAGTRARLALTEADLAAAEHALAVLLGRYPNTDLVPADARLPDTLEPVPPGLPSDLVERRPDVRAAYYRLVAADRRAAEAAAARLPSFSLTGSIRGSENSLADALNPDHMIWSALGNLVMPIFEGGRRKANADRAEAAWVELRTAYKLAALTAFREVEDALVMSRHQAEYLTQLTAQTAAVEASLRLATDRYLQGLSDFLPVMLAQAAYFSAASQQITARKGLIDARINLVSALGGGWSAALVARDLESQAMREAD